MALTIADQSVFRLPIVSLGKCSAMYMFIFYIFLGISFMM